MRTFTLMTVMMALLAFGSPALGQDVGYEPPAIAPGGEERPPDESGLPPRPVIVPVDEPAAPPDTTRVDPAPPGGPGEPTVTVQADSPLAATGFAVTTGMALALMLLLAGAVLVRAARRRTTA